MLAQQRAGGYELVMHAYVVAECAYGRLGLYVVDHIRGRDGVYHLQRRVYMRAPGLLGYVLQYVVGDFSVLGQVARHVLGHVAQRASGQAHIEPRDFARGHAGAGLQLLQDAVYAGGRLLHVVYDAVAHAFQRVLLLHGYHVQAPGGGVSPHGSHYLGAAYLYGGYIFFFGHGSGYCQLV